MGLNRGKNNLLEEPCIISGRKKTGHERLIEVAALHVNSIWPLVNMANMAASHTSENAPLEVVNCLLI